MWRQIALVDIAWGPRGTDHNCHLITYGVNKGQASHLELVVKSTLYVTFRLIQAQSVGKGVRIGRVRWCPIRQISFDELSRC